MEMLKISDFAENDVNVENGVDGVIEDKKKNRSGKIYEIYSPSLQRYYYGCTYNSLALRKAIHLYGYRKFKENKHVHYLTAFNVLCGGDCVFRLIEEHETITKENLLKRETEFIKKMRELHGGKVVNKNVHTGGLIKDYNKNYQKQYRESHKQYFKKYRDEHRVQCNAYALKYGQQNRDRYRMRYEDNKRNEIIDRLNNKSYKYTPTKMIEKYKITFDYKQDCYV